MPDDHIPRLDDMNAASPRQSFLILFPSIVLPVFMAVIDQTIVTTALPAIGGALGHIDRVSWVVVAYLCATTVAAPIYGRLGDLLGRRRFMLIALVVFLIASIGCATANSLAVLVGFRVLQGLGGGGLLTLSQALIGEAIRPADRVHYQGYFAFVAVCSSALGPVLGGLLTEFLGWRSIFIFNLPLCVAALLLALKLPKRRGSAESFTLDLRGALAFAVLITSVLLLLREVGEFDLSALPAIGGFAAAAVVAAVTFVQLERRTDVPLLPIDLFRNGAILRSNVLAACHGAVLVSLFTFVPMYLRVMQGTSPAETGLLMLPMTVGVGFGSMATSGLIRRSGRTAIFPSFALIIASATLLFVAWEADKWSATQLAWILGVNSVLIGTVMQVVQLTVQTASPPAMLGSAAGSVQFARALGAAFGTALVSVLLFATLHAGDGGAMQAFTAALTQLPDGINDVSTAGARSTMVAAFKVVFYAIATFAALGSISAWTLPIRKLQT